MRLFFVWLDSPFLCVCCYRNFLPKTKLSGLNSWPNTPALTESMVPGSKSTRTARGTYFFPTNWKAFHYSSAMSPEVFKYIKWKLIAFNISHPWPRCNKHWFSRAEHLSRRCSYRERRFHVHLKSPPKTTRKDRGKTFNPTTATATAKATSK